ncbi:hypothetical protein GCK32_018699 [Trichostrongylus colubriformis]|uniref:Arrestin-like N-terminal domain-containing protein n=1 Tax=Trichostrongylus colubriformis TaxID=6319 RepID=A0AAN8FAH4_TRICO
MPRASNSTTRSSIPRYAEPLHLLAFIYEHYFLHLALIFDMLTDEYLSSLQMPTTQLNIVVSQPRMLAGELLNIRVLVDSSDPDTIIQSLTAEIKGVGRTGWVNIHTDKIFETEKLYFHTHLALCPPGTPIPAGKHQFPLQVMIPENAPSSYESQFGSIRYQVKVVLTANTEQVPGSTHFR